MAGKKKIYVAYTGGTIGCIKTLDGFTPAPRGEFTRMVERIASVRMQDLPEYEIHEYKTLIDSSNASPETWKQIASDIAGKYDDYDGFVVLHGTDTMAQTASALSFMLQNLGKPVVVTGSQVPLSQPMNDAQKNLENALCIAARSEISEVCVCFGSRLMRGNRVVKVHASDFEAFDSPNAELLADISGVDVRINKDALRPKPQQPFTYRASQSDADVVVLELFPGITANFVSRVLHPAPDGVILKCYGPGHAPDKPPGVLEALRSASDRGTVIVGVTQCLKGTVDMDVYAVGTSLAKAGVVGGRDMTTSAAFTKLHHLCSQGLQPKEIRTLMQENICGEISS
ncbi:MAG: asparaginase [Pseudomonadota bacterium]